MQNQDDNSRRAFVDMGLLVSICVFIVLLIRSALFGFSWATIIWLLIVFVYWGYVFFFSRRKKDERMLKYGTTVFLCMSVLVLLSVVFFDKNARPKMHAFEGAAMDTLEQEAEFIVDETPDITVVEVKDSISADSMRVDSMAASSASTSSEDVQEAGSEDFEDE